MSEPTIALFECFEQFGRRVLSLLLLTLVISRVIYNSCKTPTYTQIIGNEDDKTGLYALEKVAYSRINQ